jgi:hypothetical protein
MNQPPAVHADGHVDPEPETTGPAISRAPSKLDTPQPPYIRLRWIANGEQHDKGYNFMDEAGTVYRWRSSGGPRETLRRSECS